jgi:SAM-dependent methyltransferase
MGEPATPAHHHDHALPPVMGEAFWDERYLSRDALWSGQPNPQLVAEVEALRPGWALDVGCGEGADALWLAGRGWQVTAVDISGAALERARLHAAEAGDDVAARIEWVRADIIAYDPGSRRFDLVSAQFLHLPGDLRDALHLRLARSVGPGGVLLLVAHDPTDLETTVGRPPFPDFFATAEQVAAALHPDEWEVLVAEARPRMATDGEGRQVTIHDAVAQARRR